MTTILELNDTDLRLYRAGSLLYRAPAMAVMTDREIVFGEAATRLARVYPRQTNQQYFSRMNADPLSVTAAEARNHADLVYLHLLELAPLIEEPVVLAVPGVFSTEQLGILLGILQEVGIHVSGFIDSAVAASALDAVAGPCWHLDILLQRAVLTELETGETIRRGTVELVEECGLARIIEGLINVIADRFIGDTRFDPLHSAATEQQLFDQVLYLLRSAEREEELAFELTQGEQTRRIEITRSVLEERGAERFRALAARLPRGTTVLLNSRAAALPGLRAALLHEGLGTRELPEDALSRSCTEHIEEIVLPGNDLRLVTRLRSGSPAAAPATAQAAGRMQTNARDHAGLPTHLLTTHRAIPLDHPSIAFTIEQHGPIALLHALDGITLNGLPIFRETALQAGDRIAFQGQEFLVISVEA